MNAQKVLLVVGSPKAEASNSLQLGKFLLERLQEQELESDIVFLYPERQGPALNALLDQVDEAGLVILAAPVYVDSLPAGATAFLEQLAARRASRTENPPTRFLALLNCGLPEVYHNHVALSICQKFARDAGLGWQGGLALGMGELVAGRHLEEGGTRLREVRGALELAAVGLAQGEPAAPEASAQLGSPAVPVPLYVLLESYRFLKKAGSLGTALKLMERPYRASGQPRG